MTDLINAFVFSRSTKTDKYGYFRFDLTSKELFTELPLSRGATFPKESCLAWIGEYFLEWSPLQGKKTDAPYFNYRLFQFDPTSTEPLSAAAVQGGSWLKHKFWGNTPDFGNPDGAQKAYDEENDLRLLPLGTFLLNFIPTAGRGTFGLWNFDPALSDLTGTYPYLASSSFRDIQLGDELYPICGYVLNRKAGGSEYAVFNFDSSQIIPLSHPAVCRGKWKDITDKHKLVVIGPYILDYLPGDLSYRLWEFDPKKKNPLVGPIKKGKLPKSLGRDFQLTAITPRRAIDAKEAQTPGTIDFMRTKVKHVVNYMVENRSFDHVVGWLYEKGEKNIHWVGPSGKFKGASVKLFNEQTDQSGTKKVHLSKYKGGGLSDKYALEMFSFDPYHDASDVLRQLYYKNQDGYARGDEPNMKGFVWNNGSPTVMETFSPEQLPILNGLAQAFSLSDEWFCSMPSCTDVNRAFAVSGSSQGQLNNFMTPPKYDYWPEQPHRASIWKVLWAHGITDFKIYNSVEWHNKVFTYQLFLENQIPTVDANVAAGQTDYIAGMDQFYADAKAGTLPSFSYLEPIWISLQGTSSYHPGADVILAEKALNEIYEALKASPAWEETLLVITFDEHGGIYDHVPPPAAVNPFPHDEIDGFKFDRLGPRVPTIVVSPYVQESTVFRSSTPVVYDGTSFMATLLNWYGIAKSEWYLGDRVQHAPSFEAVLSLSEPRTDAPTLTPAWDKNFPKGSGGVGTVSQTVSDLDRTVARRAVQGRARKHFSPAEVNDLISKYIDPAKTISELLAALERVKALIDARAPTK